MVDIEGKELKVGDKVVFCKYEGHNLKLGIILKLNKAMPTILSEGNNYVVSPERIYKIN